MPDIQGSGGIADGGGDILSTAPPPGPYWQRGSKTKNLLPTIIRLIGKFGKLRICLYIIVILSLSVSVISVFAPQFLGELTDSVAASISAGTPPDLDALARPALTLVALYLVLTVDRKSVV